ncbi:MAG: NAD-dependent epimerase/dehydratase family protein [Candidatus Omnitrophica bacterium]|nr:NAD-dependent epimerase/dehydratase family protein [Candidatus Omnitrophota bacterium]
MPKSFWKNKKVLVTGYEGFLGSWLAKTLVELGSRVVGIDIIKDRPHSVLEGYRKRLVSIKADVSNLSLVRKTVIEHRPSVIFHLAAEAIVGRANIDPVRAFKSNIEGTWNILEASRGMKFIDSIVVASSDKAYGPHRDLPYYEDTTALKGDHPYDVSKSCADLLCNAYFVSFKLPVCVTRCGNIYGPGDNNFSRLMPDLFRSIARNKTFMIRSDGAFTRDYIYVEDVISGYILLGEKMKSKNLAGQSFNLSNEKPLSVISMVKTVYKLAGKKPNYKILNSTCNEIKDQYLCSSKAKRILSWKARYELSKGLNKAMGYYMNRFSR